MVPDIVIEMIDDLVTVSEIGISDLGKVMQNEDESTATLVSEIEALEDGTNDFG